MTEAGFHCRAEFNSWPSIVKRGGDAWDGAKSSDLTDFGGVKVVAKAPFAH